jgi:hypothetical protein
MRLDREPQKLSRQSKAGRATKATKTNVVPSRIALLLVAVGNILWIFAGRPVYLIVFGLLATRSMGFGVLTETVVLLAAYRLCSLASSLLGHQLTRLKQCKSSFERLDGRTAEFVVTRGADEILKRFESAFSPKDRAKRQARALYPNTDFGRNIVFLRPADSNRKDRLRPPQAYPNPFEESLIVAAIRKRDLHTDPMLVFLLCHEIEHCTPDAFRLEAESCRLLIVSLITACAFAIGVRANMFAILCCVIYLLLLTFEAMVLIPAQLEARTDLRALARLEKKHFL